MIRLTILLLFGIGIAFFVAGADPNRPQGSDLSAGIEVTRLDPPAAQPVATPASSGELSEVAMAIPLNNRNAALEAALRATERSSAAAPQPVATDPVAEPALPPAPAPDYWYVTGNRVNLRAAPSTSASVIGQVTYGQETTVLEENAEGWFRIETARDGTTGYIFGKFLSHQQPL